MKKVLRNLSILLALVMLVSTVSVLSVVAATIEDAEAMFTATPSIEGYDVSNTSNLFKANTDELSPQGNAWIDPTLENTKDVVTTNFSDWLKPAVDDYSSEGVTAHSGNNCAKITGKTSIHLPNKDSENGRNWENNTYYLLSFYVYAKDKSSYEKATIGLSAREGSWPTVAAERSYPNVITMQAGQWNKVSFIIYSGMRNFLVLTTGNVADATNCFYLDDFSLIKLPENVQAAAKAFDEYDGDYSSYGEAEQALSAAVGSTFAADSAYATLVSPLKGLTYAELAVKLKAASSIANGEALVTKVDDIGAEYDVTNANNLFNIKQNNNVFVDSTLENSSDIIDRSHQDGNNVYYKMPSIGNYSSSDGVEAHSGSNCAKVVGQTVFYLPTQSHYGAKTSTYYLLSFYIRAESKNALQSTNISWGCREGNAPYPSFGEKKSYPEISNLTTGEWHKVSFLVYTGKRVFPGMLVMASGVYFDDFSYIELPENVQKAALAIDDYQGNFETYDATLASEIGDVFADNTYAGLYSPAKAGTKYIDCYDKLMAANGVQHTVTKIAGANGSVEGPDTEVQGANPVYTITPDEGYTISDVLVDGSSVGAVSTYTFDRLTADHTIEAVFAVRELSETVIEVEGATIRKSLFAEGAENSKDVDGRQGLRFRSKVSTADGTTLTVDEKVYTITGQGMLLAAASRLGDMELSLDNMASNNAIFDGSRANVSDNEGYFTSYIYNIKESQKALDVITRAYVICENEAGDEIVFYSAPVTSSVAKVYAAIKADEDVTVFDNLGDEVKAWFGDATNS